MKIKNPFSELSRFELFLWLLSVSAVTAAFLLPDLKDYMTLLASLIGVTALIFVSKGLVFGQILTVIFALFYGAISFFMRYYGEMITYLCMTPIALFSVISWIRHPYKKTKEVLVSRLKPRVTLLLFFLTAAVTFVFYFILRALDNANLFVSTLSIATSFLASSLALLRSPYYALAYAANDLVLIALWMFASFYDISYLPMATCFVMFLANDSYGLVNWIRIRRRQEKEN